MKKINTLLVLLAGAAGLVIAFTATAFAAGAVEPEDGSLLDLLDPVYQAFAHGQYVYAAALVLAPAVAIAKRYGGERVPYFRTEQGQVALVLVGAFGASLSTRLAGGVPVEAIYLWDAFKAACFTAGGYQVFKLFIVNPILKPLAEKYPKLAAPLQLILWVFESKASQKPPA